MAGSWAPTAAGMHRPDITFDRGRTGLQRPSTSSARYRHRRTTSPSPARLRRAAWRHAVGDPQHLGMRGDWDSRLDRFRTGFRALQADIVTLQQTILTERVDQAFEMLGAGYRLAAQQQREPDGQ